MRLLLTFIIVSPVSPKWRFSSSVRIEKLSKYLSKWYKVYLVVPSIPGTENRAYRKFDVGDSEMIEIPLLSQIKLPYMEENNNSFTNAKKSRPTKRNFLIKINREIRYVKQFIWPSKSSWFHYDEKKILKEISSIICNNSPSKIVLFTTYPPYFILKIGKKLKETFPEIFWVADFRDPFFNVPYQKLSYINFFKALVLNTVKKSDMVTKVFFTDPSKSFEKIAFKTFFIPNGYDLEDFCEVDKSESNEKIFRISFTGSIIPEKREITPIVKALAILESKKQLPTTLEFVYCGAHSHKVTKEFEEVELKKYLRDYGFVSREEALRIQAESDILFLPISTGEKIKERKDFSVLRSGKVFEYINSSKPILVVAPREWEMTNEIESDGVSKVFEANEISQIAEYIYFLIQKKFSGEKITTDILEKRKEILNFYNYENIAKMLVEKITLIKEKESYKGL